MIILKFPESDNVPSSVMVAKCKKPDVVEIKRQMLEILKKYYQPSLAERYVDAIAKAVNDGMAFPDDGIYQIGNGRELIKFYETEGSWNSTGHNISDYVIKSDSKFWENFNNEFCFLTELLEPIKAVVNRMSENMLSTKDLINVASIELKDYTVHDSSNDSIVHILTKAFTSKAATKIATQINEVLINKKKNGIIILREGASKYIVYKNSVIEFDYNEYAESLKYVLEQNMMRADAEQMAIIIKNQLLFGVPATLEIQERKGDGLHLSYNGVDILYSRGKYAVKCTEELFEELVSKTVEMANSKYKDEYHKGCYIDTYNESMIDISNLDMFSLEFHLYNYDIKVDDLVRRCSVPICHLNYDGTSLPDRRIIGKYIVVEKRLKSFGDD